MEESHDEDNILESIARRTLKPSPSLGGLDPLTSTQVPMEQNNIGVEVTSVLLLLERRLSGLLQKFLDGTDVAFDG